MTLHSAAYVGVVKHRRRHPAHAFRFPLFMFYLDLAELDSVFSLTRLCGTGRLCPARFKRDDYLQHDSTDLDASVRAVVHDRLGWRPRGPIRMLTHLRYFGYIFNPVTFYYCFDANESLTALVAEITNTPWGERHVYALDATNARCMGGRGVYRWRFDKTFHVSPFLPMNLSYDWTFDAPGQSLFAHMNLNEPNGGKAFDATLQMSRRALSPAVIRGLLLRFPLMTAQVIGKIHFEALRLWLKRSPVFAHPVAHGSSTPAIGSERT